MNEVLIRTAQHRDAEKIVELLTQLGFPRAINEIQEDLTRMPDSVLLACLDDVPVAVATLNVMPVLHRPRAVGRVSALVVDQECRGQGIGAALLKAAENLLRSRGCGMIEVTSNFTLEAAHAFYRAQGYEATSYRFKKDL